MSLNWSSIVLRVFADAPVKRNLRNAWYESSYVLNVAKARAQVEKLGVTDPSVRSHFIKSKRRRHRSQPPEAQLKQHYQAMVVEQLARSDEYYCEHVLSKKLAG